MLHNEIKTYYLNTGDAVAEGFAIKKMEDIHARMNGESDKPHRHDYYTVIFIEEAKGLHFVDFRQYTLSSRSIFFLSPSQVHQLIPETTPKGWVLLFTREFLLRNHIDNHFIRDLYLFEDYGETPPLTVSDSQYPVYADILRQMYEYMQCDMKYRYDALGSLLKLFLIQGHNACSLHKEENPQVFEAGNRTLRQFKDLLEQQFASFHKVGEYAEQMAISPDYLNKTIKSLTGQSAKDLIQHKLIIEAKRNLLFSKVSTKELSYGLGFEEPSHFSNFFKKHTGQTPSQFKNEVRTY